MWRSKQPGGYVTTKHRRQVSRTEIGPPTPLFADEFAHCFSNTEKPEINVFGGTPRTLIRATYWVCASDLWGTVRRKTDVVENSYCRKWLNLLKMKNFQFKDYSLASTDVAYEDLRSQIKRNRISSQSKWRVNRRISGVGQCRHINGEIFCHESVFIPHVFEIIRCLLSSAINIVILRHEIPLRTSLSTSLLRRVTSVTSFWS